MDVHVRELAARQADLVAAWQLLALGWSRGMVDYRVQRDGWRVVHPGVYALTQGALTRHQRWKAATLTAPECVLSHASAAACWGFRPFDGSFETVTRPGSGGPRRVGAVLVCRSRTLKGNTTRRDGIGITAAPRTLIDLAAQIGPAEMKRAFRETLRLKITTALELQTATVRHPRRRGTKLIGELASRYSSLPYARCRSDAESRALEVLHDAAVDPPRVNTRVAREEADLVWPDRGLIVEIDGPQYHLFPDEDARKELRWRAAGYAVRRVASDVVYQRPERLVALLRGCGG